MKSAGTTSISIALRSTVVAAFGIILMFMTSPLLTGLTLACLPLLLISFRIFSKLNMRYTAEQLTASASAATVAEECFGSIRTVSWPFPSLTHADASYCVRIACAQVPACRDLPWAALLTPRILPSLCKLGKGEWFGMQR